MQEVSSGGTGMSAFAQEVISLDWEALRALGERADQGRLQDGDFALVGLLVRTLFELAAVLTKRDATLARLRRLLFGPRSERRPRPSNEAGAGTVEEAGPVAQGDAPTQASHTAGVPPPPEGQPPRRKGHGRKPASVYTGATIVTCSDPVLEPGCRCPDHPCRGTLFDTHVPNRFLRFTGQPPVAATR